ncbi:MAG: sugar phosphate isomerase/epimerase [Planctomycetes bacterium]|nr:sugar phosphate isomerase/epimerase [Planctomycetota bacterium]
MRIGFSTSVCPEWDLPTIIEQAKTLGYEGVELYGLGGHLHLPTSPALADSTAVRASFEAAGIGLVNVATDCSFGWPDRRTVADHKARLRETMALAKRLGCPNVSIKSGRVPAFGNRDPVLGRIVAALRELAPEAADLGVCILVENDGDLALSRDMWYIVDAAGHPAVRCLWNPTNAWVAGDTHGLAVPRLGRWSRVVHLVDIAINSAVAADGRPSQDPTDSRAGPAVFDPEAQTRRGSRSHTGASGSATACGTSRNYVAPGQGQGQADLARFLLLTRGIGAEPWLIVDWPQAAGPANPTELLPTAPAWIRDQLTKIAQAAELSAYKGDKNAPRFPSSGARAAAHG